MIFLHDPLLVEPATQAADVPGVEAKLVAQLGRRGLFMVGDLVDQPRRREGIGTFQETFLERTDVAGVEPTKVTYRLDVRKHEF
jgi:hypothetical protein